MSSERANTRPARRSKDKCISSLCPLPRAPRRLSGKKAVPSPAQPATTTQPSQSVAPNTSPPQPAPTPQPATTTQPSQSVAPNTPPAQPATPQPSQLKIFNGMSKQF
jgi:hypothetical protein